MDENQTIDQDRILKINIEEEMKSSYIDYSMSVIVARVADAKHTEKDAAVYGLEAVAHIRQCAGYDYGHTVIDVRGFHFILDVDLHNPVQIKCLIFVH